MITNNNELIIYDDMINNKIYTIRGSRVMLDKDLVELYEVETRALNQAVGRNPERFPEIFMFQLTPIEFDILKSQIVTSSWGGTRKLLHKYSERKNQNPELTKVLSIDSSPSVDGSE